MERVDFEIRGNRYQFEGVPVSKSRPFLTKMMAKLSRADMSGADEDRLLSFFKLIASAMDEQLLQDAVTMFTPYTFFEINGMWPCLSTEKMHWDAKGQEGLGDQFEWLVFCLKHTYSDFLARVQKLSPAGATP